MPDIKKRETTRWIKAVAASYGKKTGEIGYLFVDDEKILEVNREYLGHDYYTDIITFDYCEGDMLNGDLVISLDTVRTNAEKFHKAYDEELHPLSVICNHNFSISQSLNLSISQSLNLSISQSLNFSISQFLNLSISPNVRSPTSACPRSGACARRPCDQWR